MSHEASTWALNDAPDVPAHLVACLLVLANEANSHGRGAYPSIRTIARRTRKTERATINDLQALESRGLIVRGDQQMVLHIPPDRRPVVYDLPIKRGEVGNTPPPTGVKSSTERGEVQGKSGVKPTSDNPTTNPTTNPDGSAQLSLVHPKPDLSKTATSMVRTWWEGLKVKPAGKGAYHSAIKVLEGLMKAGHQPRAVWDALNAAGAPVTFARLEIELNRSAKQTTPKPKRSGPAWMSNVNRG